MRESRNPVNAKLAKGKKIKEVEKAPGKERAPTVPVPGVSRTEAERLKAVFDAMGDGLILLAIDGGITSVNPAFEKMSGYKKSELVGKDATELMSKMVKPEDMKNAMEGLGTALEGKIPSSVPFTIITKDGRELPIISTTTFMKDVEGKLTTMVFTARGITELKQAEEKIRQRNEFLKNTLESLPYPFYVMDAKDYTIKLTNSAACQGSISEGSTCYALTHKRSRLCRGAEHTCPLEEVKKTKKPVVVEHIHHDKDGNARNVEVHGYPIFDNDGNVIQMIEYSLDITERKRAEEVLRESENRYRAFIEASKQMGWTTNADGEVVADIPMWRDFTGQSEDAVKGWGWIKAVHPDDRERVAPVWKKAVATRSPYEVEYRVRRHDGSYWHFLARGVPLLEKDGRIREWVGTCIDITELKRAEEQIRKTEEEKLKANKRRMEELEKFAKIAVGRELKMVELKKRIKELELRLEGMVR